ncbi:hypothetical protein MTR_6g452470 [Medicago truncatula]|uniref:Uncharacterized protein n=1 Tax=Medicago truncatula TaxID=3880 RepID=A0A072UB61_MEDTR|nr:hypothetical protein MTR_6g452470 [Medicago truncatula]
MKKMKQIRCWWYILTAEESEIRLQLTAEENVSSNETATCSPYTLFSSSPSFPTPFNPKIHFFCNQFLIQNHSSIKHRRYQHTIDVKKQGYLRQLRRTLSWESSAVNCRGKLRSFSAEENLVIVKNAKDVPGETKENFVENSRDVKPPNIEAKTNIDGASVHVEASKYVGGSGVLPFQPHEVDTAKFFSNDVKSKNRDELLEWVKTGRKNGSEMFRIMQNPLSA